MIVSRILEALKSFEKMKESAREDGRGNRKGAMWRFRWKNTLSLARTIHPLFEFELVGPLLPSCSSYSTKSGRKGKAAPLQERKMIDRFRVWAKGGDGGNGCWSVRRSRSDWRGKPDGGNGGRGGDVILQCSAAVWDFSNLQHHLNAKKGGHGVSKKMAGSRGSDKVVQVPVGTVVHLVSGEKPSLPVKVTKTDLQPWDIPDTCEVEQLKSDVQLSGINLLEKVTSGLSHAEVLPSKENGEKVAVVDNASHSHLDQCEVEEEEDTLSCSDVEGELMDGEFLSETEMEDIVQYSSIAELTESGQRLVIASGGEGGLGNAYIGKGLKHHKKVNQKEELSTPESMDDEAQTSFTSGSPGSESVLILELKSIADIGLVGMPNAGKSTLLGSISRAKPQVGHYAFTTLRPNIGKVNYNDFFSVTVADIPGIIKGAHENRGLGHAFLRHIERTKVLAYVVDLAATLDGRKGISPWLQLRDLIMELEYYQQGLSDRPSLVVANKIDETGAEDVYKELKRRVRGVPIFPVCAILEEGIPELKDGLRTLIDNIEFHRLTIDNVIVD